MYDDSSATRDRLAVEVVTRKKMPPWLLGLDCDEYLNAADKRHMQYAYVYKHCRLLTLREGQRVRRQQ